LAFHQVKGKREGVVREIPYTKRPGNLTDKTRGTEEKTKTMGKLEEVRGGRWRIAGRAGMRGTSKEGSAKKKRGLEIRDIFCLKEST